MVHLTVYFNILPIGIQQGPSISSYMAQMDKELASTSLGSSFIKKTTSGKTKPKVYIVFFSDVL